MTEDVAQSGDHLGDEVVLGVDTHETFHVAAVLNSTGVVLDTARFATTRSGYEQLPAWGCSFGAVGAAGVEFTGSDGAALTRHLRRSGVRVVEVNQPDRSVRRRRGKTDAMDAESLHGR